MNSSVCILSAWNDRCLWQSAGDRGTRYNTHGVGVPFLIQTHGEGGQENALALVLFCFGQLERQRCHRNHAIKVITCPTPPLVEPKPRYGSELMLYVQVVQVRLRIGWPAWFLISISGTSVYTAYAGRLTGLFDFRSLVISRVDGYHFGGSIMSKISYRLHVCVREGR